MKKSEGKKLPEGGFVSYWYQAVAVTVVLGSRLSWVMNPTRS